MNKKFLAAVIGLNIAAVTHAAPPSMEEMWDIIQKQQAEIQQLKSELGKNSQQIQETQVQVSATADAVESVSVSSSKLASWAEKTSIGGYGEHHFNHKEDSNDQIDAHRYVLYIGHQFEDNLRFFSEFELEHSLAGDGKPGEVELEQAFIEWDFAENHSIQIGQFLVPVGILNETHEPDTFYGTERNNVEKEIIPATWWETGIMFRGEIMEGLSYNAAVHSGLEVPSSLRIRSGRQKSAEAIAEDLAFTGRIKYTGVPGLEVAATIQFQQDLGQGAFSEDAEATLFETHAAYQTGNFGVRALYAAWDIDGAEFEVGDAEKMSGWYVEPSYKITPKLGVFARYSEHERGDKQLPTLTNYETWDYGVNYWLNPHVVLKADYSDTVGDAEGDAFNLGVGWSF